MDNVEDSGFDSDPKPSAHNGVPQQKTEATTNSILKNSNSSHLKAMRKTDLQKKLERQREVNRRLKEKAVDQQPKRSYLLPHGRLLVPNRQMNHDSSARSLDEQPLVAIVSDDSNDDDDFESSRLSKQAHQEITQQLIKDGYNLDLEPDDEDLDLIPPRPLSERYACCNQTITSSCAIQ